MEEDGYETSLVSGITSFCATAARVNKPLVEWNEQLHVIPAVHKLEEKLDGDGNYVLMKSGRKMNQVKEILSQSNKSIGANIAESTYAQSPADYISKLSIALKEASETLYWLDLLKETDNITIEQYNSISNDIKTIIGTLINIINKLKHK